jgi:AraC family ethanolamine operon transcriptional activator
MGPVGYLRRRRLSAIQTALKRTDRATMSIADIAFEYGFSDPGRFATYYRSLFGESPSQTRRSVVAEYENKRTSPRR